MNIPIPWMDCFLSVIPGSDEPIGNIWTDGSEILVKLRLLQMLLQI